MMQQKTTNRIRVVADLDPSLVEQIDEERKGVCGRAAIVRMALLDRYKKKQVKSDRVA